MSREQVQALPDDLREWVDRKAEALGTDRETVLARALTVYRLIEEFDEADGRHAAALDGAIPGEAADRISSIEERLDAAEDDFDAKIEDARTRIVQTKREVDAKAPADHGHPDLRERLDEQGRRVEELRSDLDGLGERLDAGFENYEDVLEYLTETTDDLESRTAALARAVSDARERLRDLESESGERAAVAELKSEANRHGTAAARCGDCSAAVEIGLLSAPRCPHCETAFGSFEPARGFLGSATLVPGDRPAIEGESDPIDSPADLLGTDLDG